MSKWTNEAFVQFSAPSAFSHSASIWNDKFKRKRQKNDDEISTAELFCSSVNESTIFECVPMCECIVERTHVLIHHTLFARVSSWHKLYFRPGPGVTEQSVYTKRNYSSRGMMKYARDYDRFCAIGSIRCVKHIEHHFEILEVLCAIIVFFFFFLIANLRNFNFSLRIHSSDCDLCHLASTSLPLSSAPAQKAYLSHISGDACSLPLNWTWANTRLSVLKEG